MLAKGSAAKKSKDDLPAELLAKHELRSKFFESGAVGGRNFDIHELLKGNLPSITDNIPDEPRNPTRKEFPSLFVKQGAVYQHLQKRGLVNKTNPKAKSYEETIEDMDCIYRGDYKMRNKSGLGEAVRKS